MPPPPDEPPLEPPDEPPLEPLEPPLDPLEPLEPPLGGGIPPPLGAGMPPPDMPPPPDAPPLVLQAPVTIAAKAMNASGLIQLGTVDSERRDVMVLTLCNARTPRVLEREKRG
jgi:hypothetical protein